MLEDIQTVCATEIALKLFDATPQALSRRKMRGLFPPPTYKGIGPTGKQRWLVRTVEYFQITYWRLLDEHPDSDTEDRDQATTVRDECAREATRLAVIFDAQEKAELLARFNCNSRDGEHAQAAMA